MPGNEVTMEEMEEMFKPDATVTPPPTSKDVKLEASDIPDSFKGKSVAELLESNKRLEESLRLSEDARLSLARSGAAPAKPEDQAPPDESETITRDQFEELLKTDPMKALEIHEKRILKGLGQHLEARFRPLVEGTMSNQENTARGKYKDEFELFADQINEVAAQVKPEVRATAKGWDDIVSYVRGKPENFEKLMQRRVNTPTRETARERQAADTGFTVSRSAAPNSPLGDTLGLDETQRKIAENQNPNLPPHKAWAEYKKWSQAEG